LLSISAFILSIIAFDFDPCYMFFTLYLWSSNPELDDYHISSLLLGFGFFFVDVADGGTIGFLGFWLDLAITGTFTIGFGGYTWGFGYIYLRVSNSCVRGSDF